MSTVTNSPDDVIFFHASGEHVTRDNLCPAKGDERLALEAHTVYRVDSPEWHTYWNWEAAQ